MSDDASNNILLANVDVFDGINSKLIKKANVLIRNKFIQTISTSTINTDGAVIIDGGNRVLIPGLIDVHWHTSYANTPITTLHTGDISEVAIKAMAGAQKTLMRGFTTVRDVGGNTFSIKKLCDSGEFIGPRIFPSGAPMSPTAGHFDFRDKHAVPCEKFEAQSYWSRNLIFMVVDGIPEILKRAREQFRLGATQLKIAAGGGAFSDYDPIDVLQFTFDEIRAFVEVAENRNTYVTAHVYTDNAAQMVIKAGIKSIEHGLLLSEKTLKLMKKNDVWLSPQPIFSDEDAPKMDDPIKIEKFKIISSKTDNVYRLAKKIGVKIAFGTDLLFDPLAAEKQGKLLAKLQQWFTPYEALKMATSTNAELLALCGPRNPYPSGALGVIQEGAYADLIVVDGNPLEDLSLVADPQRNFKLIMKDGKIYKNAL